MIDPDVQRQLEGLAAHAQRFAARMQNLHGEGADDDNLVQAVCAPGGRLVDLRFSPDARYLQMDQLREAVLTAAGRASEAATADLNGMVAEISRDAGGFGADAAAQARRQVAEYQRIVEAQQQKLDDLRGGLRS